MKPLYALLVVAAFAMTSCVTPIGEVERWGISGVEVAELTGEVVDVLCEVSGNCAEQCGAGSRQLGFKTKENTVFIAKDINRYTGAAEELWPFCNEPLVVNGQFTETGNLRFFQVQNVRRPDGPWMPTTQFLEKWAEDNNETVGAAKRWYLKDPRIKAILQQDGLLGLGQDADRKFLK